MLSIQKVILSGNQIHIDKFHKFDDSVHLKYCLYMTKYGHWRLSLSRS